MSTLTPALQHNPNTQPGKLSLFTPEPKGNGLSFGNFMSGLAQGTTGIVGAAMGISPEYQTLLQTQMMMQEQMQRVSLLSNIERSRHESKMAAIRNVRTG